MSEPTPSLMEFPCDFPVKIIGIASENFLLDVTRTILKHYPQTEASAINHKPSNQNNYLAITATIYAQDQRSLDALYQELTSMPGIKMVL